MVRFQSVVLTFISVNIEGDSACDYDHLTVHDGASTSDPEMLRVCGSALPAPLISTGQQLFLLFETDFNHHGNGFNASWVFKNASLDLQSKCIKHV